MQISQALLHWLENTGTGDLLEPKRFGELLVYTERKDFLLRQYEDAAAQPYELDRLRTPAAVLERCRVDALGAHRPLKYARGMPRGWLGGPFDIHGLRETLDYLYPAAVAVWNHWRAGTVPVSSYRAVSSRQMGRFKTTVSVDMPQVEQCISTLCEKQCLRQRLWHITEEGRRPVAERYAEFPLLCPHPCALFMDGAANKIKFL